MLVAAALLALLATAPDDEAPGPVADTTIDEAVGSPSSPPAAEGPVAVAPRASFRLFVDVPLTLSAQTPSSNTDPYLLPWLGVRAGAWFPLGSLGPTIVGGVDGGVHLGSDRHGTDRVSVQRVLTLFEARGLVGARFENAVMAMTPYLFGGGNAGAGIAVLSAFGDGRGRLATTWGVRTGLGLEARLWALLARVELSPGLRDLRLEWNATSSLGVQF